MMPAIRAAAVMKNARQESLRRACRQDQAHGDRPKHTSWHFLAPPTASKLLIGSFCKDRTFAVVDENDRVWSFTDVTLVTKPYAPAGRSPPRRPGASPSASPASAPVSASGYTWTGP